MSNSENLKIVLEIGYEKTRCDENALITEIFIQKLL
jgi:hypothetical protein